MLALQTPVKYNGVKGYIAARCYDQGNNRALYDLRLANGQVVMYREADQFKVEN